MSQRWTKVRNFIIPTLFVSGFVGSMGSLFWNRHLRQLQAVGNSGTIVRVKDDRFRAQDKSVYLRLLKDGGACADGSPVEAQIQIVGGKGNLVREKCLPIPEGAQKAVEFSYNQGDDRVIAYNGSNLSLFDWNLNFLAKDTSGNLYTYGSASSPGFPKGEDKVTVQAITKLNSNGKIIWSRFLLPALYLGDAKAMPSGEMVFIGYTRADESGAVFGEKVEEMPSHIFLLNAEGDQLWARSYVSGFTGMFGTGINALETDGRGNIYVSGLVKRADGQAFNLLMKLDHDGRTVWQKSLSVAAVEGMKLAPDGTLFVYGGSRESGGGFLVQVDASGNLQRARNYGTQKIWSVDFGHDGQMMISGFTENADAQVKPFVAWLGRDGRVMWSKNFTDSRFSFESPYVTHLASAGDGSFLLTSSVTGRTGEVGRVLKINPSGEGSKEVVFYSASSPAGIFSAAVTGTKRDVWMLARRTPEGMPSWLTYMGLLRMSLDQAQPCTTCFEVSELIAEDVPLKAATGSASLENASVELDHKWLDLNLLDSPIPLPTF